GAHEQRALALLLDVHRQVSGNDGIGGLRLARQAHSSALDNLAHRHRDGGLAQDLFHHSKRTHDRRASLLRSDRRDRAILAPPSSGTSLDISFFSETTHVT